MLLICIVPVLVMSVMRHEGWHAAQDCMAGTIKNNFIAIIKNEEDVPRMYQAIAKILISLNHMRFPGRKKHTGQDTLKV